jgi:hypothetical protein
MGDRSAIEWTDAKACAHCGVTKAPAAFARDRSRPDGLTYWCRECRNARGRASYDPKGPPGRRGWLAATRDGDGKQARRRVNYLVEQGLLSPPGDEPCWDCADMSLHDGGPHEYDHARGYDGENQLYVEPVCQRCHQNREEARRGG